MSTVTLNGQEVQLLGKFLNVGDIAPDFILVNQDLETVILEGFPGKKVIATIPSIDTPVCSEESKNLDAYALKYPDITVIVVSKDTPFAQKRYKDVEHLSKTQFLSDLRPRSAFGQDYGVEIKSSPLEGLFARSILCFNENDRVIYSELVEEITKHPDLEKAFLAFEQENQ